MAFVTLPSLYPRHLLGSPRLISLSPLRCLPVTTRRSSVTRPACMAAEDHSDNIAEDTLHGPNNDLPAAGIKTEAGKAEDAIEQTWWGLAWFVVITVGMLFGIVATLARDFVPGGLGPPV